MLKKTNYIFFFVMIFIITLSCFVNADSSLDCNENYKADFKIMITECSPSVVTSNLLAEQDVAVYCQLEAIRLNSLLQSSTISSISFTGDYPEGVKSISYHPINSAYSSDSLVTIDDVFENIGYVVVVLSKQPNEDNLTEYISGLLTARVQYKFMSDYDLSPTTMYFNMKEDNKDKLTFFSGLGSVYLAGYNTNTVNLKVDLLDSIEAINSELSVGQSSDVFYLPGFECKAGFSISFDGIVDARNSVSLNIDGDNVWLREGDSFPNGKCTVQKIEKIYELVEDEHYGSVLVKCIDDKNYRLNITNKSTNEQISKPLETKFFPTAISTLNNFTRIYPREKIDTEAPIIGFSYYAEKSLFNGILLAIKINDSIAVNELGNKFLEEYPNSVNKDIISSKLKMISDYDMSNSGAVIQTANQNKMSVSVNEFKFLAETPNVVLEMTNISDDSGKLIEQKILQGAISNGVNVYQINPSNVSVLIKNIRYTLQEGESRTIDLGNEKKMYLDVKQINIVKTAKITINPKIGNGYTNVNFSFNIPVEKRTISLTPEKAKEKAENLNDTLEVINNILDTIDTVYRLWKGGCTATKTFMAIKMMAAMTSGEGVARMSIMKVVKAECYNNIGEGEGKFSTIDQCIMNKSADIDKAVKLYRNKTATLKKEYEEKLKSEDYKDRDDAAVYALGSVREELDSIYIEGKSIDVRGKLDTTAKVENAALYNSLLGNGVECLDNDYACKAALLNLYNEYGGKENLLASKSCPEGYIIYPLSDGTLSCRSKKDVQIGSLEEIEGDSQKETSAKETELKSQEITKNSCEGNKIDNPEVRYYGSSSASVADVNEGRVSIVPVDIENGWYAYVANSYDGILSSNSKSYDSSGAVNTFYICNVGSDNVIDYEHKKDICQSFDINSNSFNTFIGCNDLSSSEIKDLYNSAISAINSANKQYGKTSINVLGSIIDVGQKVAALTNFECMDLLSPNDCVALSKICDPIECPSSKCNLGGKYSVADVTQTGVVGSIILCQGSGFWCFSGIYSGLKMIVSVIEEYQSCLETRATTGEFVGSCDKIYSFYICEFAMKQIMSFAKSGLNSIINSLSTGVFSQLGLNGGGEYLSFSSESAELSTVFKEYAAMYVTDTITTTVSGLFNLDTGNASNSFCNTWFGTVTSDSSTNSSNSVWENLWNGIVDSTDLEEGYQFTAKVQENSYSDATVPPTSKYNVYYHLYAGSNDVTYSIYMSEPPATSAYSSYSTKSVVSGIISAGESKVESLDFTAPSGYKKLCVVVNGKANCDFGISSSNFVVNQLVDEVVNIELNKNITTEKECLSVNSVINFIDNGVLFEDSESVSSVGINRVCSSVNPEQSALSDNSRWKDVGSCGDETLRCYMDTSEVSEVLSTFNEDKIQDIVLSESKKVNYSTFDKNLSNFKLEIESGKNLSKELNEFIDMTGPTNGQKAYAYYLLIDMYYKEVEKNIEPTDGIKTTSNESTNSLEKEVKNSGNYSELEIRDGLLFVNNIESGLKFKDNEITYNDLEVGNIIGNNIEISEDSGWYLVLGDEKINFIPKNLEEYGYYDGNLVLLSENKIDENPIKFTSNNGYVFCNDVKVGLNITETSLIRISDKKKVGVVNDGKIDIYAKYENTKILDYNFTYSMLENYYFINDEFVNRSSMFTLNQVSSGDILLNNELIGLSINELLSSENLSKYKIYDSNEKVVGYIDANTGAISIYLLYISSKFQNTNVKYSVLKDYLFVCKNKFVLEDEYTGECVDATDKSSCERDGFYWYNGQCNECSSVAPILWEGNCKSNAQMSEICEIQNREYTFGASYCGDCKEGCEEHDGLCITPSTEVGCTQLGLRWCGNNCYVFNSNKVCFQNEYISKNTMCQSQGKVYNSSSNSCFCNAGYKADPNGNCLNDAGCPESTPEVFDGECKSMEYIINECHESQKRNIGYIYTFSGDKVYSYCDDCLSGYTEVDGKCVSI